MPTPPKDALQPKNIPTKNNTQVISGAEALLRCLVAEQVKTIFGYPGGAIMPVYDALYHYEKELTHILARHEQGAIHAAQGYARAGGGVGVVFTTSGPGATNILTGLADALADSTPLVCITGQVAAHLLGTDAFQESDIMNLTTPVTKWNILVTDASQIPEAVAKAFYIAKAGRPGPVLIDIAKNAQIDKFSFSYEKCEKIATYPTKPTLNKEVIATAAALLNQAKKPFILAGQGVTLSNAEQSLLEVAEKAGIPVASTLLGLSAFPTNHLLYVGYLGMHGNYSCNINTNECDVILAVGMRFDDRVTGVLSKYAPQATIIHIDIDEVEINKLVKTKVGICADAKEALDALCEQLQAREHTVWRNSFKTLQQLEYEKVIQHEVFPTEGGLTMAEVVYQLGKLTNGNALTVTDVGQHQMVVSRYYPYKQKRSNITSGGIGTMGFSLPAAMGAKVAMPERQVVCIVGDGGIQMTSQELATIFQYNIKVKILLLNNEFLGMVRQWQEMFFEKRYSQTNLINPDFVKLADAYGVKANKVGERENLEDAITEMLAYDGAFLLEVRVRKDENIFPMIPTGAGVAEVLLEKPNKQ